MTDPWSTLDHPRDTTLRLIEEAVGMGIGCAWADVLSVRWEDGAGRLSVYDVAAVDAARDARSFRLVSRGTFRASDFDVILYRPDPPVDLAYLHPLQLVSMDVGRRAAEEKRHAEIVNPARVLFAHSEKLLAFRGSSLMPPTMVASRWDDLSRFGEREGCTIAKPVHLCQSKDVELLEWTTRAARERSRCVLERLTGGFARPAVLQRFLPGILDGETRVWMLDGESIGVASKRSAEGSYRIDMDKGGLLLHHVLTEGELRSVSAVGTWLRQEGVRLAAVDLIDGWVTDLNFTSPGLLPSMETIAGRNLARPIVRALAGRVPLCADRPSVSRVSVGAPPESSAAR